MVACSTQVLWHCHAFERGSFNFAKHNKIITFVPNSLLLHLGHQRKNIGWARGKDGVRSECEGVEKFQEEKCMVNYFVSLTLLSSSTIPYN